MKSQQYHQSKRLLIIFLYMPPLVCCFHYFFLIDEFNPVNYAINMCNRNINISGTRSFIIHIGGMNLKTKEQNNLVNCNKTTKIADKHNNFIWPNINTLCTPSKISLFFFSFSFLLRKIDFDFEGKSKLY